jgi:hypothetical protein
VTVLLGELVAGSDLDSAAAQRESAIVRNAAAVMTHGPGLVVD